MSRETARIRTRTRTRIARLAGAVATAAIASGVLTAAPRPVTPEPQSTAAPRATLRDIADERTFQAAFDSAATMPRIVLLLSPT